MRSLKTECTVLALAMLAGFAHANEDSAKAQVNRPGNRGGRLV